MINSLAFKQQSQKPKKKQDDSFLDAISKRDAITGKRSLNVQNELAAYKQGRNTLNSLIKDYRNRGLAVLGAGNPDYDRVARISKRIIAASHYATRKGVRFEVIDSNEVNAFATGGGHYVVHTGLMDRLNDDELAFVIAHELVHNVAGHIEEQLPILLLNIKKGVPASIAYSNVQEQEADKVALVYTALAGYNPCAGVSWIGKDAATIV